MQLLENIAKSAKRECRGTISRSNLRDQQQLLEFPKQLPVRGPCHRRNTKPMFPRGRSPRELQQNLLRRSRAGRLPFHPGQST